MLKCLLQQIMVSELKSQNHQCENHKGLQYDKGAPAMNKSACKLHGYIVLAFKIF